MVDIIKRSIAAACVFALFGAAPPTNPVMGSWENASQTKGIELTSDGHALFFQSPHMCPVFWATFTRHGRTIVAEELNHKEWRTIELQADGTLRYGGSDEVYRRVPNVSLTGVKPGHC